jgi:crotonobetainyl-CoA:carnitine CoA-transferase CaiB-like acyl-CoA transferase
VIDLSTLWAGPLCAHLLGLAGARVIRVESVGRPDGARGGPAPFYDLLHAGQESVAVDPRTPDGLAALRGLLAVADVVVESARPRALAQLGIDAARWVRRRPGLVWVSLTGYGRTLPERSWVAFGDDAGAAAGLAFAVEDPDLPLFCGDAIGDPLAGAHAALAASVFHQRGQSVMLDVSLCGVAEHVAAGALPLVGDAPDPEPPRARRASGSARALGADTEVVLREFPPCAGPEPGTC